MSDSTFEQLLEEHGQATTDGGPGREPLPDSDYLCKVVSCKYQRASTGSDMWKLKLEVLEGPYKGRWVWDNIVLKRDSSGSVKWFFGKMRALGLQASFFAQNPDNDTVAAAVVDAVVECEVGRQSGDDRYNEVKTYKAVAPAVAPAPAAAAPAPAPEAQASAAPAEAAPAEGGPAMPKSPFA